MSNAFRETNTNVYRQSVTFITGFNVVADEEFNIGGLTSTNSYLNTYNVIKPLGGISGYLRSGEGVGASVNGLISTGSADLRYLQTGISGGLVNTTSNQTIDGNKTFVGTTFILEDAANSVNVIDFNVDTHFHLKGNFIDEILVDVTNKSLETNWSTNGNMTFQSGINITSVRHSGSTLNLGTNSFYIHTGNSIDSWILPTAASSPGRFYFMKNIGNTVTLTGASSTERLFTTQEVLTTTITSGNACIVSSDSVRTWMVM